MKHSLKNILFKFFGNYLSMFSRRDPKKCVFGAWKGDKFADNSKYLYLYFISHGFDATWITRSEKVFKELKDENLPVAMADSKQGEKACLEAKYVFICTGMMDVNDSCIGNAILINLWHGIPLKRIMYDDKVTGSNTSVYALIKAELLKIPYRHQYVVSTSNTISDIYTHAFRRPLDHILQFGQPRNDGFFDGSLNKIKYADVDYDKLVLYMPTHRNQGKTEINIEAIFNLEILNKFCIDNKTLFVIKKHFYHSNEKSALDKYTNILDFTGEQFDTQELLFNADILITDYSSCYIDYLLLNRPVIFYDYDINNYNLNDREFYFDYNSVTPGPKCSDFDSLYKKLNEIFKGNDEYILERKKAIDIFYAENCREKVAEKIYNWVQNYKS